MVNIYFSLNFIGWGKFGFEDWRDLLGLNLDNFSLTLEFPLFPYISVKENLVHDLFPSLTAEEWFIGDFEKREDCLK